MKKSGYQGAHCGCQIQWRSHSAPRRWRWYCKSLTADGRPPQWSGQPWACPRPLAPAAPNSHPKRSWLRPGAEWPGFLTWPWQWPLAASVLQTVALLSPPLACCTSGEACRWTNVHWKLSPWLLLLLLMLHLYHTRCFLGCSLRTTPVPSSLIRFSLEANSVATPWCCDRPLTPHLHYTWCQSDKFSMNPKGCPPEGNPEDVAPTLSFFTSPRSPLSIKRLKTG